MPCCSGPEPSGPAYSERIARLGLIAAVLLLGTCLTVLISFSPPNLSPNITMASATAEIPIDTTSSATHLLTGTLEDIYGSPFDLTSLRGQTSVLYFASIDSLDAVANAERLNELSTFYPADSGVQIVSLNQDTGAGKHHQPLSVRVHAKMLEVAFPTLLDTDARIAGNFNVAQAGHFVVIDPVGDVIYRGPFEATASNDASQRSVHDAVREAMSRKQDSDPALLTSGRQTS